MQLLLHVKMKTTHFFSPIFQPLASLGTSSLPLGNLTGCPATNISCHRHRARRREGSRAKQESSGQLQCGHQRDPQISMREHQGRLGSGRWLSRVCLCLHGEFMGYFYTQILPPWKNKDNIRAIDASKSISLKFLINIKL